MLRLLSQPGEASARSTQRVLGAPATLSATAIARPLAAFSSLQCAAFLAFYMAFHALHVARRDPPFMRLLSPIPLFSTSVAAMLASLIFATVAAFITLNQPKLLERMAKVLVALIVLFTLEILIFP